MLRTLVCSSFALALLAAPAAADTPRETCRSLHADKRKTALERWRGPRSNANRYPNHCENERITRVLAVPLDLQLSNPGAVGLSPMGVMAGGAGGGGGGGP